jgi:hypothetical protein
LQTLESALETFKNLQIYDTDDEQLRANSERYVGNWLQDKEKLGDELAGKQICHLLVALVAHLSILCNLYQIKEAGCS